MTTPIVLEYEEVIAAHMGLDVAETVIQILERAANVRRQQVYYRWGLIQADPDDNKFVDCVLAGGADYLVTRRSSVGYAGGRVRPDSSCPLRSRTITGKRDRLHRTVEPSYRTGRSNS